MNNFKKGGFRKGGNNKFDNRSGGSGRPPQLFPAVCAQCGKNCEVPFRPTGDKPVYCRDCFSKQNHVPGRNSNGADGPRPDFRRDGPPQRTNQPEYARPQNDGRGNADMDAIKRHLDSLESKMNRVLELVAKKPEAPVPAAAVAKVDPKAKEAKKKAVVRKAIKKGSK